MLLIPEILLVWADNPDTSKILTRIQICRNPLLITISIIYDFVLRHSFSLAFCCQSFVGYQKSFSYHFLHSTPQ